MSFAEYLELAAAPAAQQLRSAAAVHRRLLRPLRHRDVSSTRGARSAGSSCSTARGPTAATPDRPGGGAEPGLPRAARTSCSEGAANKLVLLHGPNGSAKSTFVRCIGRALEHYSTLDEGALYRFNWIFPAQKVSQSGIGFGGEVRRAPTPARRFAYLPDELIDAKLADELRDHPLLPGPVRGARAAS